MAKQIFISTLEVTDGDSIDTNSDAILLAGTTGIPGTARVARVDNDGNLQVDVLASALPTGAATSAAQLPDGHNVTVDNAGGGAAVPIQDGGNSITVDGTVAISGPVTVDQPVAVTDNAGSLTVDGTVAVSSVGGTVAVSAASLPLPTGAATAANQLPDGHNVTVDNAGGASAVPIQDGGNSITVDGTVGISGPVPVTDNGGSLTVDGSITANAGTNLNTSALALETGGNLAATATSTASIDSKIVACNTGSVTVASSALPTGAATAANQLPDGHNVTVDNAGGGAAVPIQDGGNSITVDGTVGISGSVNTELNTDDLDTGAGTDTQAIVGVALAASGGHTLVGTANPMPVSDAGGSLTVDGTVGVSGTVAVTQSGTWNLNNISGTITLPTGAATAANQLPDGHNVTVDNAAGAAAVNIQDGGNSLTVDGTVAVSSVGGTVAVSAASLPLPTGAATESTLSTLNSKVPVQGQAAMAASTPVAIASNQSAIPASQSGTWNINNVSGTVSLPTGAATETTLSAINTKTPSLGQAVMASSVPVAIASNQTAIPVTDNSGSLTVDNAGTFAVQAAQSGSWSLAANQSVNVAQMAGVTPSLNTGVRDAGTQRVTIATNDVVPASQSGTWNIGTVTNITNQGQLADNAGFTDGTTRLNMSGHIFDETAGTALTENDAAASRVDSKRAQICTIEDETTRGRRTTVTAANALKVDGSAVTQPVSGTVTVNQPVAVTDNSGSLTVDNAGTFAVQAAQSGTWNVTNVSGTVSLPTGAATESTLSSINTKTPSLGQTTKAGSVPTTLATEHCSAFSAVKTTSSGSGAGLPNFYYNFAGIYEIPSMFIIDPASLVIPSASNASLQVTGDEAHDAVDDGNPHKIGVKAASYAPASSDQPSANKTAVAANDRSNVAGNLFGEIVEGVNPYFFTLDNISTTYNNTTTTATSTAKNCWNYRQASFACDLTRANSPTDILFEIEVSLDGTNYQVMQNDFLGDLRESTASITASGVKRSWTFPIACQKIRVKVTATGTTAVNTFTVANAALYLRN